MEGFDRCLNEDQVPAIGQQRLIEAPYCSGSKNCGGESQRLCPI
jgi:hypothetical protein